MKLNDSYKIVFLYHDYLTVSGVPNEQNGVWHRILPTGYKILGMALAGMLEGAGAPKF